MARRTHIDQYLQCKWQRSIVYGRKGQNLAMNKIYFGAEGDLWSEMSFWFILASLHPNRQCVANANQGPNSKIRPIMFKVEMMRISNMAFIQSYLIWSLLKLVLKMRNFCMEKLDDGQIVWSEEPLEHQITNEIK
eukprot:953786_1